MSEEFEVKGPHEEVLEANEESSGFNGRLAVMTAIMATIGAILSYEASVTLGEAIIFKNEASIKKTDASDQWNFYQAKNNKQSLAELGAKLTTGKDHDDSLKEALRYGNEKSEMKNSVVKRMSNQNIPCIFIIVGLRAQQLCKLPFHLQQLHF
jgi:hypothetical protein